MKGRSRANRAGFTLLEVVVAMAILALALVAVFDLNAGAIASHAYSKKLTVASLLARSKMTDIEQRLYDKGFSIDDEEESGDFSEDGWSGYRWRAKIIAPKTNGIPPEQVLGAIFNLPLGTGDTNMPQGGLSGLVGGTAPSGSTSGPTPSGGLLAMFGPLAQTQFTQMVDQITKLVREIHLTVTWREGKQVESLDLVTHVVSMGPGGDRNGTANPATSGNPQDPMVNARTGAVVTNPVPGPGGRMVDPSSPQDAVIPLSQFQGGRPGGSIFPNTGGLPFQIPGKPK